MTLHAFCSDPDRPICMMRGLCAVLGVDLDLFSSDSLVHTCPDHEIEVRDQVRCRHLIHNNCACGDLYLILVYVFDDLLPDVIGDIWFSDSAGC